MPFDHQSAYTMLSIRVFPTLLLVVLLILSHEVLLAQSSSFDGVQFVETFDGDPSEPTNWSSPDWDLTVHFRDRDKYYETFEMMAAHGSDCGPPPATHPISLYEEAVFNCKNHLMTALTAPGYGVIYMTPRYMVDFTDGEAVIKFDLSTLRESGRDWVDIWLSPFEDQLQTPLTGSVDLQGPPKHGIQVVMDLQRDNSKFRAFRFDDHVETELVGTGRSYRGYEYFLIPDARRRDTFELRIAKTHLTFGMPDYDFNWFDLDIDELDWTKAMVQLGHHSYNPTKDCEHDGTCGPTTWHWDNVEIAPATPITMIRGNSRYADEATNTEVTFNTPSPSDAFLRFSGIGLDYEISTDNGNSWFPASKQSESLEVEEHFSSYLTPIDAGVTQVQLRANDWWGGPWHARSFSIISEEIELPLPIELSDFDLEVVDNDVRLSWTTLSEIDNSGFFVEMRQNDDPFLSHAFVTGIGNSQEATNYLFTVENLAEGSYDFRLRQRDFSGNESFSQTLTATIDPPNSTSLSNAFPNPFTGTTSFSYSSATAQDIQVELSNHLGQTIQLLYDGGIEAGQTRSFEVNAAGLSAGTYFYRVMGSDDVSRSKALSVVR